MAPTRLKVLALVLAIMVWPCLAQSRRSRQILEQANESLAAGLHHKAVELYSTLLTENPEWAEPRFRRAVAYSGLGEAQQALDDLGVLLQTNAKHAEALQLRGDLMLEKDRPANAVESYTRAMQAGVQTAAVYKGRAAAYAKLRQWDKAVPDYSECIRLKLNNPAPHVERGKALYSMGKLQDAIEDFDRAIALDPNLWEAYTERAEALGASGRFDLAMADLNKVLAAKPSLVRALSLRGSAHIIAGEAGKALADYSKAIELSPQDVQLLLARGTAYAHLGDHRKSLADREAAVRLRPRMAEAYIARGGTYHELGEHEKGLQDRSEAIRLAPSSGFAWMARGNAYFLLSRYAEAAADLKKAVELSPEDQPTRELLQKAEAKVDAELLAKQQAFPAPAATQVEAKVSALTAVSIFDIPKSGEPSPGAAPVLSTEVASVSIERATPVSEQAVFTPAPPTPPAQTVAPPAPPVKLQPAPAPVAKNNQTADQLNLQGRALSAQSKFTEAVEVLSRALVMKPDFPLALNARGFAFMMIRKPELALADFSLAVKLDPNYANAYHNRSIVLQQAGQAKAAEEDRQTERRLAQQPRR